MRAHVAVPFVRRIVELDRRLLRDAEEPDRKAPIPQDDLAVIGADHKIDHADMVADVAGSVPASLRLPEKAPPKRSVFGRRAPINATRQRVQQAAQGRGDV